MDKAALVIALVFALALGAGRTLTVILFFLFASTALAPWAILFFALTLAGKLARKGFSK